MYTISLAFYFAQVYHTSMKSHTSQHQMKFYGAATVGTKGQVVIPVEARDTLGIAEGDKLLAMGTPAGDGVVFIKAGSLEAMMQDIQQSLSEIQEHTTKESE